MELPAGGTGTVAGTVRLLGLPARGRRYSVDAALLSASTSGLLLLNQLIDAHFIDIASDNTHQVACLTCL